MGTALKETIWILYISPTYSSLITDTQNLTIAPPVIVKFFSWGVVAMFDCSEFINSYFLFNVYFFFVHYI